MGSLSGFMPGCRWVIVDTRKADAPHAAANDKATIIRIMHRLP